MARWEDTPLSAMPKITKDPIQALIESQREDEAVVRPQAAYGSRSMAEDGEIDSAEDWDSVYGDQEEAVGQDIEASGAMPTRSHGNPINLNDDFPGLGNYNRPTTSIKSESEYESSDSQNSSMIGKLRTLEVENAWLLANKQKLEKRIAELENLYADTISGVSNHTRASKDYENLSATVLINDREVLVANLSPQMSGWDFTRKVEEAAGVNPGHMIVMQHSPIRLDIPLNQHGLGTRPFYAVSLGHRRIERGQSLKVQLLGRGPLI